MLCPKTLRAAGIFVAFTVAIAFQSSTSYANGCSALDKDRKDHFELTVGIDLGGTKIVYGLVNGRGDLVYSLDPIPTHVTGNPINKSHRAEQQVTAFFDRMMGPMEKLTAWAAANGFTIRREVGIGSPGYIEGGTTIAADSALQLGTAFNGLNVLQQLQMAAARRFPGRFDFSIRNDAIAQVFGGIKGLAQSNAKFQQMLQERGMLRVAYVGPGTSLGGAFVEVTPKAGKEVDIKILDNNHHIAFIPFEKAAALESPGKVEGGWATPHADMLSGTAIKNQYGITGKELADLVDAGNPQAIKRAQRLGYSMFRIMKRIHDGRVQETLPALRWTKEEQQQTRGIDIFVWGGSIGTRGKMGEIIRKEAENLLKKDGIDPTFYVIGDAAGGAIAGAAALAR